MAEDISTSLYVAGTWRSAAGNWLDVHNPVNGTVVATMRSATPDQVHEAVLAAREAQRAWARMPPVERGGYLRDVADLVDRNAERLGRLITTEMGKPVRQASAELEFASSLLRYSAEWDRRLEGEILPGDVPGEVIHLLHCPVGVVGAICPWNFPLAVLCRKLGPALITGNAVVIKPSEISPLSALELLRLVDDELDLPPGVVNLVNGAGATGHALVADAATSMVSFTGHRDTGKSIMAEAASDLTRVALELGGKAPAIVWQDADLDLAVPAIVAARHTNSGQVCTSAERVFVHGDVYGEFLERYLASVAALEIGDPTTLVDLGPLASAAQLAKTTAAVQTALEGGARAVTGKRIATYPADGYFFTPTVLTDISPDMPIMREETFGPVTPVYPITSLDEAVALANDSPYGLSAYVFSRDYQAVMRLVQDLEFGEIYINRTLGESVHAHHAGYRQSGIGGEDGKWGLLRYTQIKTTYHHYG